MIDVIYLLALDEHLLDQLSVRPIEQRHFKHIVQELSAQLLGIA